MRRVQSTVGVSALRGTASGDRNEAQGHGIRACSEGVRDQWFDDLIGDEGASAICGDEALEFVEPVSDSNTTNAQKLTDRIKPFLSLASRGDNDTAAPEDGLGPGDRKINSREALAQSTHSPMPAPTPVQKAMPPQT